MKWSWKIARIQGIDVHIHATFLLLIAWFGYHYWKLFGTFGKAVEGMVYIIALFGCVVLHEFGHALVARRYKVVTSSITLLPIGGVASMDKLPEDPWQEIKVALAGPAVNVVIAVLLWVWLQINHVQIVEEELLKTGGPFAYRLMLVNIFLVVFNLLPAFPTDGGRVLRASLALFMKHHKATAMAASIGQKFALLFGLLGLLFNPFLLLIAVFLWFAAEMENNSEQIKVSLGGSTVKDAMLTEFHILSPQDNLKLAIQLTLASDQRDFPVGDTHKITHLLTQKQLLEALHQWGDEITVDRLELPVIEEIRPEQPLEALFEKLQGGASSMIAVNNGREVIGIVTMENLLELVQFSKVLTRQ